MKIGLKIISYIALLILIAAPIGVYLGKVEPGTSNTCMMVATILWFATAPFWMGRKEEKDA